eukprot:1200497-Rhodomonas_salina.1
MRCALTLSHSCTRHACSRIHPPSRSQRPKVATHGVDRSASASERLSERWDGGVQMGEQCQFGVDLEQGPCEDETCAARAKRGAVLSYGMLLCEMRYCAKARCGVLK